MFLLEFLRFAAFLRLSPRCVALRHVSSCLAASCLILLLLSIFRRFFVGVRAILRALLPSRDSSSGSSCVVSWLCRARLRLFVLSSCAFFAHGSPRVVACRRVSSRVVLCCRVSLFLRLRSFSFCLRKVCDYTCVLSFLCLFLRVFLHCVFGGFSRFFFCFFKHVFHRGASSRASPAPIARHWPTCAAHLVVTLAEDVFRL